jgi:hypothetical protein
VAEHSYDIDNREARMKPAFVSVVAVLLLSLVPTAVFAKNVSIGIYALVDQVTFEPVGAAPNLVRISGVFVVPIRMSSGDYLMPQRGYLYFKIQPGMEQAIRKDWNELKHAAGTRQVIGFAQYWVPNPDDLSGNPHHSMEVTVHAANDGASPDAYPLPNLKGIVKHGDKGDPNFDKIAGQLHRALLR